jgi:hypothetical protein
VIKVGINDRKLVESLSLFCSLRTPVNKHLSWKCEEGRVLFILVVLRALDAVQTAEKKQAGVCIC